MYDLKIYLETCRSMYYDLEAVLPKPFVYNEEELLERLSNNNWTQDRV